MFFKTSTHIFVDNCTEFWRSLRIFCKILLLLLLVSRSCKNSMLISSTNNSVSLLWGIRTSCCLPTMTKKLIQIKIFKAHKYFIKKKIGELQIQNKSFWSFVAPVEVFPGPGPVGTG